MSAQHTPGPWEAPHIDDEVSARQFWVCDAAGVVASVDAEHSQAREITLMIAALPELLATLKDVLRIATAASLGIAGNQPRLERARAAIAKATGASHERRSNAFGPGMNDEAMRLGQLAKSEAGSYDCNYETLHEAIDRLVAMAQEAAGGRSMSAQHTPGPLMVDVGDKTYRVCLETNSVQHLVFRRSSWNWTGLSHKTRIFETCIRRAREARAAIAKATGSEK